ncbi:unnamed protein product [Mytilus edulis]|uniref:C-type lectin domain-containing protein n=1 Tax=Mytilus edulis TaxID=6550 RepID=A0A8S3RFU7_MYTED|nr:unnamed protein product [Mytilus edulis]
MRSHFRIIMKWCCLIVFIFCTIGVSKGGRKCLASNGKCGEKNVSCNETFGPEWTYNGKCCSGRPCCKFLKAPCVPETCPHGFKLLSNQTSSANCYSTSIGLRSTTWHEAFAICAQTDGAYMWRPNNEQEAKAVFIEFNIPNIIFVWTGANDIDKDGNYTFAGDNSPFSFKHLPFGQVDSFDTHSNCAVRLYTVGAASYYWDPVLCSFTARYYICEYKLVN